MPQLSWVTPQEVCPKQVAAFPAADDSQLLTIQSETETRDSFCCGFWEPDVHQAPGGAVATLCFAQFEQKLARGRLSKLEADLLERPW